VTLAENAATWDALGAADPLWAVLSTENGRDGGWDVAEFLATGHNDVGWLRGVVERAGAPFGGRALDFGCGVGRLSQALAPHTEHVVGVDVAASMLQRARALNPPETVEFVHSVSRELPFQDGAFDLVISLIVLQHMPAALSVRYLLEFARVLRPGGVMAFQLPSEPATAEPLPANACRAGIEVLSAPRTLAAGETGQVRVRLTNAGDVEWPAGQMVKLGNHWLRGGQVAVLDDGRWNLPAALAPGQSLLAELRICAPAVPGGYEVELDMVQEFVAWWADNGGPTVRIPIEVTPAGSPETTLDGPSKATHTSSPEAIPAGSPDAALAGSPEVTTGGSPEATAERGEPLPAARPVGDSVIEIYPVSHDFVRALLGYAGCRVLRAEPDQLAGPGWRSYTYVAERVQDLA
jgi:SAM-dependent methyltransferase